jgi:hypothetical protein
VDSAPSPKPGVSWINLLSRRYHSGATLPDAAQTAFAETGTTTGISTELPFTLRLQSRTSNIFQEILLLICLAAWGFPDQPCQGPPHIAHDPGARLRDIAASVGITERRAHGILTEVSEAS